MLNIRQVCSSLLQRCTYPQMNIQRNIRRKPLPKEWRPMTKETDRITDFGLPVELLPKQRIKERPLSKKERQVKFAFPGRIVAGMLEKKPALPSTETSCGPASSTECVKDPYAKPIRKCVLCRGKEEVALDYKNTRLLSQFLSPNTGRIYGRHITGLCVPMQKRISQLIVRAQKFCFLPRNRFETAYLADPRLSEPYGSKVPGRGNAAK